MKIKNIPSHSKKITKNFLEKILTYTNKKRIAKKRLLANQPTFPQPEEVLNKPYLFVLSTGRCGTELLTKILNISPSLYVEHNPCPELEYVSSRIQQENVDGAGLKYAILASRFETHFLEAWLLDKTYVETNNRISVFAPTLAQLLPNSKFIHLIRNPSDFVRSGMRRGYYSDGIVQHQRLNGSNNCEWSSYSRLKKIAWEWNEINKRIETFKSSIDQDRIITIKSEQLFKDPKTPHEIFKFIEVKNPFQNNRNIKRLSKLLKKPTNKQKTGSFPKYAKWTQEDKNSLEKIATLAKKYNYNLDITQKN